MGVPIAVTPGPHGYEASCPALPGCKVVGRSLPEARRRLSLAVQGYLRHLEVALPRELDRMFAAEATPPRLPRWR